MTSENEIFEDLIGYEERYKINKNGEIWSCRYNKKMKHLINETNYKYVRLKKTPTEQHKCFIHRLLAIQYLPNPDNLPEVDHIDRIRQNNLLSNLRWCSHETNQLNKSTNLCFKTEEELKERSDRIRERKREWAMKKNRANGVQPKVIGFDNKTYNREWMQKYRANLTQEERDKINARSRELALIKKQSLEK